MGDVQAANNTGYKNVILQLFRAESSHSTLHTEQLVFSFDFAASHGTPNLLI
jgi:hypothetical protein